MQHLAAADEARDVRKAKSHSDMANAVKEGLNYLGALVGSQQEEAGGYGEAYATTSDSESSIERSVRSRARSRRKDKKPSRRRSLSSSRSRSPPRRSKSRANRRTKKKASKHDSSGDDENHCKYCKKFGRTKPHPNVPEKRCNWNKKYDGWRPEWVCRKMKLRYTPREDFDEIKGGYPSSDGS